MDDATDKRLRETADQCIKAYEGWMKSKKDLSARENLMEALHELRKVASRVEIEVAVSERDEVTARPLPIPPHRASQARPNVDRNDEEEPRGGNANRGGDQGNRDPEQMRRRLNPRGPRPAPIDETPS